MYKESFYNIEIEIDEQKNVLLYNSITSALSWFDPETYATFKNRKNILKENVLPDIIRLGYVVEKEKDELSMLKYQNRVSAYNNNPQYLHFVIAPTMLCNYKCIYCFEKQYAKNCNNIMDERTIDATYNFIIKKIKEFKPKKGINVQWFGGEPLLAIDVIEKLATKLIKYTDENNYLYQSYVITNGYFMDEEMTERLIKIKVTGAQITMDGMKENYNTLKKCPTDAFDKVVENIANAQYKLGISIRVNVSEKNKADIKNLIKYLALTKKIKSKIYIADIRDYSDEIAKPLSFESSREQIIEYGKKLGIDNLKTQLPKRRYCSCEATTNREFVIGPTGKIYRCTHFLNRKNMESGDVFSDFKVTKTDLMFFDYKLPSKCDKCKILPVCMGGCICDRKIDKIKFNCEEKLMNLKFEVKEAMLNKKEVK